jgi:hypothetical protein
MPQHLPTFLLDRLRTRQIPSTVPGSLPVLFFGDPFAASIATIGINPSRQEYLSPKGAELSGRLRRFETLSSIGAKSRETINDSQADSAVLRMRAYFDADQPVYEGWFKGLSRVVRGMGASFTERSAVHLDLVQEAADPTWSDLLKFDRPKADAVLRRDFPFLSRQVEEFAFRAIVCTSKRVEQEVIEALDVNVAASGELARLTWKVGTAKLARGVIGFAAWNIPLKKSYRA